MLNYIFCKMLPMRSYLVFLKDGTWAFFTLQSVQSNNVRAMMPEFWLPCLEVSCSAGPNLFCRKNQQDPAQSVRVEGFLAFAPVHKLAIIIKRFHNRDLILDPGSVYTEAQLLVTLLFVRANHDL